MSKNLRYGRVIVKLSGEMLCSPGGSGIDSAALATVVAEIAAAVKTGAQVAVVIGGGNFLRGRQLRDDPAISRVTADYMGMLATTMNALPLRDALEHAGLSSEVLGAIFMECVCDPVDIRRARGLLDDGVVVILAGGTGRPFVTTDTCAALRACELGADAVLKATKVDGVYDSDPQANPDARRFDRLTYQQVLTRRLGVMDLTAISMCMDNNIPIVVFELARAGNLAGVISGKDIGTFVGD